MEKFFEADGSVVLMFFYKQPISEEGERECGVVCSPLLFLILPSHHNFITLVI